MIEKKYFGIADTVSAEGQIDKQNDIMLLEFHHVTFRNDDEILVVSIDHHVAEILKKILNERFNYINE